MEDETDRILVSEARGHASVEVCPLLSLEKTRRHDHRAPFSYLYNSSRVVHPAVDRARSRG